MVPVTQPPRDREAVEVGEHHVEHDQVGPELVDRQLGGSAGADLHRLEALVAEGGRDGVRDRGLVVDDEHLRGARGEDRDLCHGSKSASVFCELPESFLCRWVGTAPCGRLAFSTLCIIVLSIVVDIAYAWIDPGIRLQ